MKNNEYIVEAMRASSEAARARALLKLEISEHVERDIFCNGCGRVHDVSRACLVTVTYDDGETQTAVRCSLECAKLCRVSEPVRWTFATIAQGVFDGGRS